MAAKRRHNVYLSRETSDALVAYRERHRDTFRFESEAIEHLLRRALLGVVSEEAEGLLAPAVERVVREATRQEVRDHVEGLIRAQTERLAGLLARTDQDALAAGKDAAASTTVAAAILEVVTGDPVRAQAVAGEARLRAGAKYARRDERARGVS